MSGTFRFDGAQLSYLHTGAGMPVVFLHPTPLDHDYWRPLIAELNGGPDVVKIRPIAPDLRGHGRSELGGPLPAGAFERMPDAPVLSMQQLAADTLALLDRLNLV